MGNPLTSWAQGQSDQSSKGVKLDACHEGNGWKCKCLKRLGVRKIRKGENQRIQEYMPLHLKNMFKL